MPFNFRLNVQQVFRRLGIQTGSRLPQLDDNVQMVMILTDLSRLVPAPIEPRGFCGVNLGPSVGNKSVCQLQALGEGGIFVESMLLRGDAFVSSDNYLLTVTANDFGMPIVNGGNINIGGSPPIRSRFTAQQVNVALQGVSMPATPNREAISLTAGIFVANQSFFQIGTKNNNSRLDISIVYRELPSVEEAGL